MTKAKTKKPATPQPSPTVLTLKVDAADMGKTQAECLAMHVVTVAEVNATTGIEAWSKHLMGSDLHVMTLLEKIEAQTAAVQGGDMSDVEAMLFGQALTLQTVFSTFTRKAAQNLSANVAATELCLRLAFKAQSQCRSTLETLADIKNPRAATFIKQANVAQNQQVNNGSTEALNDPHAHEKTVIAPNEILTDERAKRGNPMDGRTKSKAGAGNPRVEAVGTGHRASHSVG